LIFEGFNEMLDEEHHWAQAFSEEYETVNEYNQLFVDTVRHSNGFNPYRCLIVNTYAANSSWTTIEAMRLPEDSMGDRLIVSVHSYENAKSFAKAMKHLYDRFVSNGIPCIVGEMGHVNKNGREKYARETIKAARDNGIPCIWWDDVGVADKPEKVYNYALMNRRTATWYFEDLLEIMMESAENGD
jgi:endoglucanase